MKDKAGHKHRPIDVFDFPDNSDISSIGSLGENEKDEEPYETFDPPLHSTAIYADEAEFSQHCGSSVPSTPQGKEGKKSSNTSENEASENESIKSSAKKPRKLKPISESESSEDDVRRKVKSAKKVSTQQHATVPTVASSGPAEKPAESVPPQSLGPLRDQSSVEKESHAAQSHLKTQKKGKISPGKRKKSRREAVDSDISESMYIWCLEGRKTSDIMELDIVLSAFEKTLVEYRQRVESKICKEAINKFYFNIKEELVRLLKEVQMLKNLKRKNAKMTSDIERKRQRLIEVQDELLRLEPQLKQLQTKYEELQERKSSLRNAAYFLSNLKQLYHDYSVVQEKEPNIKEMYDSSSLPALLFKARTLLGAENHLQNINHQLGKLLDQE